MEPFSYIGIFSVCLGDGFASIAGKLIPSFKLVNSKTISGSLVVFCATFFSYYYFFPYLITALILGILAVLVELFDADNYDNLFLPLIVSTSSYFVTSFFIASKRKFFLIFLSRLVYQLRLGEKHKVFLANSSKFHLILKALKQKGKNSQSFFFLKRLL